jgi:hypothetical protein
VAKYRRADVNLALGGFRREAGRALGAIERPSKKANEFLPVGAVQAGKRV